jgi:hypothetical protein
MSLSQACGRGGMVDGHHDSRGEHILCRCWQIPGHNTLWAKKKKNNFKRKQARVKEIKNKIKTG